MEWIQPMEPILADHVKTGAEWIHEIKWDGIRGLTYIENGKIKVFTKRGNERTAFYPELFEILDLLDGRQAVLDGEIVIFDSDGNPSFYSSLVRERVRDAGKVKYYSKLYPVKYILFDIMNYNGKDLTAAPLLERKSILEGKVGKSGNIIRTDSFPEGTGLYELMKAKNWEGIVSKRKDSRYMPGKAHDLWFKTKLSRKMLAVVAGIQWKDNMPNSLLLGVYKDNSLVFVGKASLGLSQQHLCLLKEQASGLKVNAPAFERESLSPGKGDYMWLKPALTCWVHFMEYTNEGQLRHPKILGFSTSDALEANGKEYVE
ncbi:MAG: RNA ligase family protein [Bacillota bacterium]|nr:RNA ligase family protein [Bacillota bacterium]